MDTAFRWSVADTHMELRPRDTAPTELDEQLARRMAHDVNNYLTAIVGFASAMRADSDDELESDRGEIIQLALHAAEICRFLVHYQRPLPSPRQTDTDANHVLGDMKRVVDAMAGNGVVVHWDLDVAAAPVATTEDKVEQIILNLVLNARAAMPDGGVLTISTKRRPTRHLPINGHPPADHLELVVCDTGMGMDEQTLQRIFEPSFTTKGAAGSGLGMATVLELVNELGGAIEVDSEVGGGTRVHLTLPLISAISSVHSATQPHASDC